MQYSSKKFIRTFITTIGIDFKIKTINVDGKVVKLQVWPPLAPAGPKKGLAPRNWSYRWSLHRFGILPVRIVSEPSPSPTSVELRASSLSTMSLIETPSTTSRTGWSRSSRYFSLLVGGCPSTVMITWTSSSSVTSAISRAREYLLLVVFHSPSRPFPPRRVRISPRSTASTSSRPPLPPTPTSMKYLLLWMIWCQCSALKTSPRLAWRDWPMTTRTAMRKRLMWWASLLSRRYVLQLLMDELVG